MNNPFHFQYRPQKNQVAISIKVARGMGRCMVGFLSGGPGTQVVPMIDNVELFKPTMLLMDGNGARVGPVVYLQLLQRGLEPGLMLAMTFFSVAGSPALAQLSTKAGPVGGWLQAQQAQAQAVRVCELAQSLVSAARGAEQAIERRAWRWLRGIHDLDLVTLQPH